MNIGVITTSYPRYEGDPAGNFVAAHVAELRALGHGVEVISAEDDPLFAQGGAPELLERGGLRTLASAFAFSAKLTARVIRRAHAWDLAIAHWLVPSALAAVPTRVPLLAIAHGGDVHTLARLHLLKPMIALLRARGAKLAFVSAQLRALAGGAGIVQPMGIDLAHFARIPRTPTTPPTIAVIARAVPVKGIDVAVAAMRHVTTPAELVIASDITTHARDALLARASLVVIPSRVLANGRSEGTPMIALEALAAGIPVIGSRVGGLQDLPITLVAPEDPRALAAAIDAVLALPPTSARHRGQVAAASWRSVTERLLAHAAIR